MNISEITVRMINFYKGSAHDIRNTLDNMFKTSAGRTLLKSVYQL